MAYETRDEKRRIKSSINPSSSFSISKPLLDQHILQRSAAYHAFFDYVKLIARHLYYHLPPAAELSPATRLSTILHTSTALPASPPIMTSRPSNPPTGSDNTASTGGGNTNGRVNGGNRQTGGSASDGTLDRQQVAAVSTSSLQLADASETQDVDLARLSEYPATDGNDGGSNS
ncbi:hypothetical protein DM02DRAFT_678230 [Periconia macrospinosa]|uniref:Uncharacterized protein n=1 Tax=Periconia macrospinosa TaxID=97972 RepID=A0A2V1CZI3_9PLEO|nr:hypothetical protein DM02DRAFT_678230 [Periconia macrospinosa]